MAVSDNIAIGRISSAFKISLLSGPPLAVPPGPLVNITFEFGMSACNAVAHGDVPQKVLLWLTHGCHQRNGPNGR
jgi:hypothetical protein